MLRCVTRELDYPTSDSIINKQFGTDATESWFVVQTILIQQNYE